MPSEKAKENKLLVAECAACQKSVSVELMTGVLVRKGSRREKLPVCDSCLAKGWKPPDPAAENP